MKSGTISAAATMALLIGALCADASVASADDIAINENGVRFANTVGDDSPVTNNNTLNNYDSSETNTALTTGDDSLASITGNDSSTSTGGFSTTGNNNTTTVSNVLKTKHDTTKNSVGNVRSAVLPVVNTEGDEGSVIVTTNIDEPSNESTINTTRSNIKSSAMATGGTTGNESPVDMSIDNSSSEQTGNLDLSVGQVEALSVTTLSATVSSGLGDATTDPIPGVDVKLGKTVNIVSGDINGNFSSQGGITNVQQNSGANSVLQGSVSLAMKPPTPPN